MSDARMPPPPRRRPPPPPGARVPAREEIRVPAPPRLPAAPPPVRAVNPPAAEAGDSPVRRGPSSLALVRLALSTPSATRQAILLREVLGPPVSMRTGTEDRPT